MLQKTVNIYAAPAVAGDKASLNPTVYTPFNCLAGEGGVKVGGFVWAATPATDPVTVKTSGTGAPLGFVVRSLEHYLYNTELDGSLTVVEGGNVPVAMQGDFYVVADSTVAVGATVYADTATGEAKFSGTQDTGFRAMTAGNAGDLVIISNQTLTA